MKISKLCNAILLTSMVSLIFFASFAFSQVDVVAASSDDPEKIYIDYLAENAVTLDTATIPGNLEKIDTGFDDYNVFLIGEGHGVAKNYDVELYFAKYFNQTQGVRHLMIESGYCDAQLTNLYLKTGDTQYLKEIFKNLDGTFAYSQQAYDYYVNIYHYNQTLPVDQRLEFVGVDIQHQFDTGIFYLAQLLPDTQPPEYIQETVELLNSAKKGDPYSKRDFGELRASIQQYDYLYETYLGDNFNRFEIAFANIEQGLECYGSERFEVLRENYITQNFTAQYEENKIKKCYGVFGATHTNLNVADRVELYNLGDYLNHDYSRTAGKVASISFMYFNSYHMDRENIDVKGIPVRQNGHTEVLAGTTPDDLAFYRLDYDGSIFIQDGSTAFHQYIVVIKNSPAAKYYGNK